MNRYVGGIIIASSYLLSLEADAFLRQRFSASGKELNWRTNSLTIFVNPENDVNLTESEADQIAVDAISQWNGRSRLVISKQNTSSPAKNGQNDLYFSEEQLYFGSNPRYSSVLAVTVSRGYVSNGEVVEADVLINNQKTFNNEKPSLENRIEDGTNPVSSSYFLGDVVTHEIGHFVGLAHSQVKDSTMLFTVFRGENIISQDDKSGVYSIFPNGTRKGIIRGKIVGGTNSSVIGIFGAHVQAVSSDLGKVVSSTFSDQDGSFSITGLPTNDSYFLYISPGNVISKDYPSSSPLPYYYTSAKSNYCPGGTDYVGSFYESCSGNGHPEAIFVDEEGNEQVNVGSITIRCEASVAQEGSVDAGDAFIVRANNDQTFTLDLSDVDVSNKKLRINLVANSLQLSSRFSIEVHNDGNVFSKTYSDFDQDGDAEAGISIEEDNLITDTQFDVNLNSIDKTAPIDIKLAPVDLDEGLSLIFLDDWYFPPSARLKGENFGLVVVKLVDADGNTVLRKEYSNPDNLACIEGPSATSRTPNQTSSSSLSSGSRGGSSEAAGAGGVCGSINIDPEGPDSTNGPMAVVLTLFAGLLFGHWRRSQIS